MLAFPVLVVYELEAAFGRILAISRVFCSGSALFCFTFLRNSNLRDTVKYLGSNK